MSSIVLNPSGQPASPVEGEVYYDSTADKLKVRDASGFREVISKESSGGIDIKAVNGSTTHTFTIKGIGEAIGDSQTGTGNEPDTTDSDSGQFAVYNGSTKLFGITEHGYVLKPNQPAFRAENAGDVTSWNSNQALSTQGTWTSPVNRGSNFNTTNGRYTAPVTGAYFISYGVSLSSTNNSAGDAWSAMIYLNGSVYFDVEINYAQGSVTGEERHSGNTLVIELNAGDYIQVGTDGINSSTFTLVYATLSGHLIG